MAEYTYAFPWKSEHSLVAIAKNKLRLAVTRPKETLFCHFDFWEWVTLDVLQHQWSEQRNEWDKLMTFCGTNVQSELNVIWMPTDGCIAWHSLTFYDAPCDVLGFIPRLKKEDWKHNVPQTIITTSVTA